MGVKADTDYIVRIEQGRRATQNIFGGYWVEMMDENVSIDSSVLKRKITSVISDNYPVSECFPLW